MKALVKFKEGKGNIEVRDVTEPVITRPDEVIIKVAACGVCGTDLHILNDEFTSYPPVTMGHEFSGTIYKKGDAATKWNIGDRVVCEPFTGVCFKCDTCRQGWIEICDEKRSPGWGINGAFADYVVVPDIFLHKVPDNVDMITAALCEPLAIVTHEVLERGPLKAQDFVAVIGAGPIGILAAFAAKENGARKVVVIGRNSDEAIRLPMAKELGADYIFNSEKTKVIDEILALTDNKGVDLVVEASGSEGGANLAVDIVRKLGRITAIGIPANDHISFQWGKCIKKVIDIKFNLSSSVTAWDKALSMMSNTKRDLSKIITHKASIDDWEKVFNDLVTGRGVKAMFVPKGN
jgi:L-iditol 2-dehydrogenase